MRPDQIRQTAAEIAEQVLLRTAKAGQYGWPAGFDSFSDDDEAAIATRLHEIAEEVATRA